MEPARKHNLRTSPRASLKAPVNILFDGNAGEGSIRDISSVGLFVESAARFDPGSMVEVRFQLPDTDEIITSMVWVIWTQEGAGFGAQFMDLNEKHRDMIEDYVTRMLLRPARDKFRPYPGAA